MDCSTATVLSLCSGAGGLELGLKLVLPQSRTVCYVEGEAYVASILAARMADETLDAAPIWSDVRTFDAKPWRGCVDIITAGYPCQPFSIAGRKQAQADPRHLWPYIADIVRTIAPRLCIFENVAHHLRLGFEQVHDDLHAMGYRVAAGLFTAEEVGAPHKRERLFIVAYHHGHGCFCEQGEASPEDDPQGRTQCSAHPVSGRDSDAAQGLSLHEAGFGKTPRGQSLHNREGLLANAQSTRTWVKQRGAWQGIGGDGQSVAHASGAGLEGHGGHGRGQTQADITGERGLPLWPPPPNDHDGWAHIPEALKPTVCGMADGVAHRVDRLRACGNGVVPLAAAHALRTLFSVMDA